LKCTYTNFRARSTASRFLLADLLCTIKP
jgi:hypothetical protein